MCYRRSSTVSSSLVTCYFDCTACATEEGLLSPHHLLLVTLSALHVLQKEVYCLLITCYLLLWLYCRCYRRRSTVSSPLVTCYFDCTACATEGGLLSPHHLLLVTLTVLHVLQKEVYCLLITCYLLLWLYCMCYRRRSTVSSSLVTCYFDCTACATEGGLLSPHHLLLVTLTVLHVLQKEVYCLLTTCYLLLWLYCMCYRRRSTVSSSLVTCYFDCTACATEEGLLSPHHLLLVTLSALHVLQKEVYCLLTTCYLLLWLYCMCYRRRSTVSSSLVTCYFDCTACATEGGLLSPHHLLLVTLTVLHVLQKEVYCLLITCYLLLWLYCMCYRRRSTVSSSLVTCYFDCTACATEGGLLSPHHLLLVTLTVLHVLQKEVYCLLTTCYLLLWLYCMCYRRRSTVSSSLVTCYFDCTACATGGGLLSPHHLLLVTLTVLHVLQKEVYCLLTTCYLLLWLYCMCYRRRSTVSSPLVTCYFDCTACATEGGLLSPHHLSLGFRCSGGSKYLTTLAGQTTQHWQHSSSWTTHQARARREWWGHRWYRQTSSSYTRCHHSWFYNFLVADL